MPFGCSDCLRVTGVGMSGYTDSGVIIQDTSKSIVHFRASICDGHLSGM